MLARDSTYVFLHCDVLRSNTFEDLRNLSQPVMAAVGLEDGENWDQGALESLDRGN